MISSQQCWANPSPLTFPPFRSIWPRSPRWSRWDAQAPARRGTRCSWTSCPSLWLWWGMELQRGQGERGGREANWVYLCSALGKEWGFHLIQQRSGPSPTAAAGLQPWNSCLGAPWPHGKPAEIYSSTGGGLVARQQMVLICYYSVSNEIYSVGNTEQNSSSTCLL